MDNYEKQAQDFLNQTQTTFKAEFIKYDFHFDGDKEKRDIYKITLQRGTRKMVFNFGQSINDSKEWLIRTDLETKRQFKLKLSDFIDRFTVTDEAIYKKLRNSALNLYGKEIFKNEIVRAKKPTPYDILASLQNYEVGSFENFCDEFGYNIDSKKAEKTYNAVLKEWQDVQKLWSDEEIALLQEIS